jgi:hypothetical protein
VRVLAAVVPVRVSLPDPPVAFSVLEMVSVPAATVYWAVVRDRFTVTPAVVVE